MSCNCNNNFNDNFEGGGCGCGGCSDGFKGRNKDRKQLQKEEGLTRQEARKTVKNTTKNKVGKQVYLASNPAMSGGTLGKFKNIMGGNPALLDNQQPSNPSLQNEEAVVKQTATSNPNPSMSNAVSSEANNAKVNPAMGGTTSQTASNPNMQQNNQPRQNDMVEAEADAETVEVEEVDEEGNPVDNNAENAPPKKKMGKKWWFVVGAIIALLLIVLLLFFIFRKKPE